MGILSRNGLNGTLVVTRTLIRTLKHSLSHCISPKNNRNQRIFGIFRGYEMGTFVRNEFKVSVVNM